MRYPLVMGNWKLNGNKHMVNELIAGLRTELNGVDGCGVAIAPPVMYLDQAKQAISGSPVALGAQNRTSICLALSPAKFLPRC